MQNRTIFSLIIGIVLLAGSYAIFTRQSATNPTPTPRQTTDSTPSSPVTTSTDCTGIPTPQQTEGPYYKSGSPQRNNIAQSLPGEKLVVTGFVFDKNCNPIPNAQLDFWQADSKGVYDNAGYTLRGHQFTDSEGKYVLETIVPSSYETRPPHIHVKLKAPNDKTITSQLYFPQEKLNQTDSIFNSRLIMDLSQDSDSKRGKFNFVLP